MPAPDGTADLFFDVDLEAPSQLPLRFGRVGDTTRDVVEPRTRSSSSPNGGFGFFPNTSDALANTTPVPCRRLNSMTLRVPVTLTSKNPQRIIGIVSDTDDRGQVQDHVDTGSRGFLEHGQIGDIALHEPEVGVPIELNTAVAVFLAKSQTVTESPRSSNAETKCDPMKP